MKRLTLAILCIILAAPGISLAKPQPFDTLANDAIAYFTPMKGSVLSVQEKDITTELGTANGLKPGMRLLVLRGGEAFVHPITGARIGQAEDPVGMAEAVSVTDSGSTLKLISGEAKAGDILRVSSAPVKLLFFQANDVDWDLAEDYFDHLEKTNRFDLIETAPGDPVNSAVLAEARRLDAEAALVLTSSGPAAKPVLKQRILWVEGSSELMSSEVTVPEDAVRESHIGEKYFAPNFEKPSLGYVLPHSAILMTVADLDGNGKQELVFSSGSTIRFFSFGATLTPALKGIELETGFTSTHIWLQAYDLNADGRDELIITSTDGVNAHSYVYRYNDSDFELLWKDNVFARVVNGKLYAQRADTEGGYSGDVFPVVWQYNKEKGAKPLVLPEGMNIYDFQYLRISDGTRVLAGFDAFRKLNIFLPDGTVIWRSKESYGWPDKTFGQSEVNTMVDNEAKKWGAGDRMLPLGRSLLVIKRTPVSTSAPGLGNASAQVLSISPDVQETKATVLADELPGGTADIAVLGDKLLVLVDTTSINPIKLIKGRGLFDSKVFIYPLRGK